MREDRNFKASDVSGPSIWIFILWFGLSGEGDSNNKHLFPATASQSTPRYGLFTIFEIRFCNLSTTKLFRSIDRIVYDKKILKLQYQISNIVNRRYRGVDLLAVL